MHLQKFYKKFRYVHIYVHNISIYYIIILVGAKSIEINMDKLQEAAIYYKEELEDKKFHITAGKKGETMELTLCFDASNFKHLLGLHKLTDIPQMSRPSDILYQQILDGKTHLADISESTHYEEINTRLENFFYLKDTILSSNTMQKSNDGSFYSIRADTVFIKNVESKKYTYVFGKIVDDKETAVPVSFFCNNNPQPYLEKSSRWTVLSVEEVSEKGYEIAEENSLNKSNINEEKIDEIIIAEDPALWMTEEEIENELEKSIGSKPYSNGKDIYEEKQKEENEKSKTHSNRESDWEEYVRYMNFVNQQNNKKTREREDEGPERDDY